MMATEESPGAGTRSWLDRLSQAFSAEPGSRDDLVGMLREAEQRDIIDADALSMIEGAIEVGDMHVRDIMVPRAGMAVVQGDSPPEAFIADVIESGHSRFPVIGDTRDEIVGILLAKDLLSYFARPGAGAYALNDVLRPAVFIPESKRLNVLLREFRASRNHMAIVADEYGGVAGLVTIEDVLEQIVGEIDDEHDSDDTDLIKRHARSEFTVKAHTPIEDFNEVFGTHFSDEEFDTIGGLVVKSFGHFPRRGESRTIAGLTFKVLRADKRRVHLVQVNSPERDTEAQPARKKGKP